MNHEDKEDFVIQCIMLQHDLHSINKYSPRVWASVCGELLVSLCKEEENPAGAFKQIVDLMTGKFEDKDEID